MRIILDPGEMAVAIHVASSRRMVNQVNGITDRRRDDRQHAIALDMLGAISELAFCKAFGAYPDLTVQPRKGGPDVVLKGKYRWDVKATDRPNGRLLATTDKDLGDADYYALAVVNGNAVDFVGYASAAELLHPGTVINLGLGPTHALDQSQLRSFDRKDRA
jgi:hypothetical protein